MPDTVLARVVEILDMIARPQNLRDTPLPSDPQPQGAIESWFDGGYRVMHTGGGTHYFFDDGTRARQPYPWETEFPLVEIEFPDNTGARVEYGLPKL